MRLTWLGWAGVELEVGGATVVVDPLKDAGAVFAHLDERTAVQPPHVVAPPPAGPWPGSSPTSIAITLTPRR